MTADTEVTRRRTVGSGGEGALGKAGFLLQKGGEALLAVFGVAVQVNGAPGTIFAVEQLFGTFQFVVVVVGRTAVGAAPVLDDVPVGALATIAGGDEALVTAGGVEGADDVAALLGKLTGQHTLVLQAPEDNGG